MSDHATPPSPPSSPFTPGPPAYPGPFGRMPAAAAPPAVTPPRAPRGASPGLLLFLLLVACAALGATLNWAVRERGQRVRLSDDHRRITHQYVLTLAKRGDDATFLTDRRTRLFNLAGVGPAAGRSVTVAWQEETRTGLLIGGQIPLPPDRRQYVMWHLGPDRRPTPAGAFLPDPATTFHAFVVRGDAGGDADPTAGFTVSVESTAAVAKPGAILYQTR